MSFPLESFVNSVKTLSSQGNLSCLCEFLQNSADLLSKNLHHIDTALAAFSVEQHSLGVLAALLAKFSAPSSGGSDSTAAELMEKQMHDFIHGCVVDQVRYTLDSYAELCHLYTQKLLDRNRPIKGLLVLQTAISKIQANVNQLTSIHADLCRLALSARCFRPALDVLDVDIADISKENGKFEAKHLLLYYYYGGMVYAAVKRYERALYFFEIYFTVPALAVSHIQVEAFKKHILLSLILRVESRQQQKVRYHESIRQTISRRLRPLCVAYTELAAAFHSPSPEQLTAVVTRNRDQYLRDQNMGLVKQCITSHHKMNIQRLTKTFLTLSLADVASRVQLPSPQRAEMYIVSMIEDGEIFATVNQRDGMVRFHDNPEQYNSPAMVERLRGELAELQRLERRLQLLDEEIQLEPQYVHKCHKSQEEEGVQACSSSSAASQNNKAPLNMM